MIRKVLNIFVICVVVYAIYTLAGGDLGATFDLIVRKFTEAVVFVGEWLAGLPIVQDIFG